MLPLALPLMVLSAIRMPQPSWPNHPRRSSSATASSASPPVHLLSKEPGILCNDDACTETPIYLTTDPATADPGLVCELQEGLHMDGQVVWACGQMDDGEGSGGGAAAVTAGRSGEVTMSGLAEGGRVDVSDLGLTMEDLEKVLDPELLGGIDSSGYQSSSRVAGQDDQGVAWSETIDEIEATLRLPGLRGQPTAAIAVDFTDTTCVVTAFGMAVWSCVLVDEVEVSSTSWSVEDGPEAVPAIRVRATKQRSARWSGFLQQVGENSIL